MAEASFPPLRVGVIGCGNISQQYFKNCPFFPILDLRAVADLTLAKAEEKAREFKLPKVCSVDELLADPEIELIVNLTVPQAHATINLAALRHGKHVYCEKPFSLTLLEGQAVLAEATERNLRVGCAPDTVLGGGIQTCRKLVDDGALGQPVAATANFLCGGHEAWHPSPAFYYQEGGGPIFDMGPYYLTSLITLFGPACKVTATSRTTYPERTIQSEPLKGKKVPVEVPTHLTGTVEFINGALATITMSFDVSGHHLPRLEVYGSKSSLSCPDPNTFNGEVQLWSRTEKAWNSVPLTHEGEVGRGLGIADMAHAIRSQRPHRMNGQLALHVVEIMEAFHHSASSEKSYPLQTRCEQPAALPTGLAKGVLD